VADVPDLRDESQSPAAAAAALRAYWGIGVRPISDLVRLIEAKGVRVFSLSEQTKNVDAFSYWRGDTPYVFLNTFKSSERSRFDAAHELGHLVLHRHGARPGRDAEREADQFASAFLIPREDLLGHLPRVHSLAQLVAAKERWGISVSALARNAFEAGLISDWHYREMCKAMSVNGYRSREPNSRPREVSVLWKKVFEFLWKDRLTTDHVAREINLPSDEIEALLVGLRAQPKSPTTDVGKLSLRAV
jgi:Zn-dependent peptidase ImmA (M78 family)